ncbi:hypothetical protein MA16_Dca016213 [Dendrobium catenatum]|uniref:Uncharacterized protein n=1 Tax=Dendrobium catenatum TaxID=906689 RepID=A0A2I0VVQ7_9ASPA|nr:hypothetical protein MA16_Dca016213 [Dendrobium catenatum]
MSNERYTIEGFDINRPFDHSLFAPDLTPISKPCHSRKTINRALILHKTTKKSEKRREKGERENHLLLDHRRSSLRRLNTSELCQIFGRCLNSAELCKFASS